MMHTNQTLYDELKKNLGEIEMQIKHIKNDLAVDYPKDVREKLNVWYWTRNVDGTYVLAEMLAAKSRVISAMAALKAAEMQSRAPRR